MIPSYRITNALGLALCIIAMAFAMLFLEYYLALDPCPLCLFDRAVVVACGVTFLIALLHNPLSWGRRIYGGLGVIWGAIGIGIGARHIWLQNLPADQVPSCGADLGYMLETLPFTETLQIVFQGSGECASISWVDPILGLTIPEQTLIVMIVLTLISAFQCFRPSPEDTAYTK